MPKIDKYLEDMKSDLEKIEVPDELENRLRTALNKPQKRPKIKTHGLVASIIVALLIFTSYNYSAIAYYSRKILGFDQIAYGTLGDLNDQRNGQIIGESYSFQNGVKVTLEGVMLDDNQMVAFYTITDESGNSNYDLGITSFKGFWGKYNHNTGNGLISDDETEVRWISTYDAPKALDRTLTFDFSLLPRGDNPREMGEITFKLDRSKAMGHTIKQTINKSIMVEGTKVHFDSIIASPTVTKVVGSLGTPVDSIIGRENGEMFNPNLEILLVIDGERYISQGRQISSSLKGGYDFEFSFEGLTSSVNTLEIHIIESSHTKEINKVIDLNPSITDQHVTFEDNTITIKEVDIDSASTSITIESDEHFSFNELEILVEEHSLPFRKVINVDYTKDPITGGIKYKRTFLFDSTNSDNFSLQINQISTKHITNKVIDVPVK